MLCIMMLHKTGVARIASSYHAVVDLLRPVPLTHFLRDSLLYTQLAASSSLQLTSVFQIPDSSISFSGEILLSNGLSGKFDFHAFAIYKAIKKEGGCIIQTSMGCKPGIMSFSHLGKLETELN